MPRTPATPPVQPLTLPPRLPPGVFGAADFGAADEEALHQSLHRVCTKQGHLLKKGRRVPSWKRRYFALSDGELFYYYAAEMSNPFQPLGVISMAARPESTAKSDSEGKDIGGLALSGADGGGSSSSVAAPMGAGNGSGSNSGSSMGGGSSGAISAGRPVIIQPHCTGDNTLPRHFPFAVHTASRTYYLAADSAKERDDWVRVLCACGAQLSASSTAAAPPSPAPKPAAAAADAEGSTDAMAVDAPATPTSGTEMRGLLYKRASKVHIAQKSEAQTGQARDWVARHFCLRDEGTIVYYQNADDPAQHARGIVPLAGFERVEHAQPPTDNLPYAFRLTARDGAADGGIVLAAPTEEERNSWLINLSSALAEARAVRDAAEKAEKAAAAAAAAAGEAVDSLATSLEEASLDAKLGGGAAGGSSARSSAS